MSLSCGLGYRNATDHCLSNITCSSMKNKFDCSNRIYDPISIYFICGCINISTNDTKRQFIYAELTFKAPSLDKKLRLSCASQLTAKRHIS